MGERYELLLVLPRKMYQVKESAEEHADLEDHERYRRFRILRRRGKRTEQPSGENTATVGHSGEQSESTGTADIGRRVIRHPRLKRYCSAICSRKRKKQSAVSDVTLART